MGKKTVSKKEGKGKEKEQSDTIDMAEVEKEQKEALKEVETILDNMSELNFKDFKKGILEMTYSLHAGLSSMFVNIFGGLADDRIQREAMVEEFRKFFKDADKCFGIIDERIHALESYALVLGIRTCTLSGNPLDLEGKKDLAKMFGLSWDEVVEDLKHHLKEEADKSTLKVVH